MKVTVEPVQWVMRIHPDFDNHPNVFNGSASVSVDVLGVATIRGLVAPAVTTRLFRAVEAAMIEIGAKEMVWARRNGGEIRYLRRVVTRPDPT